MIWIIFMKILKGTIQITLIEFDDMIADMLSNKTYNPIVYQRYKTKYFSCFYHTILFCSTKICQTILQTFFIKKILNSLESFNESHLIIYQILTLKTLNLYKKCTAKLQLFHHYLIQQLMIGLEMKNCNTMLIEKQQKYLHYNQIKLMLMNILQAKKSPLPIKVQLQRFTYSPLRKALEKQTKTIDGTAKKQKQLKKELKSRS